MFSETLRTPRRHRRTDGRTIKGFRAQPPGKPVRMRILIFSDRNERRVPAASFRGPLPLRLEPLIASSVWGNMKILKISQARKVCRVIISSKNPADPFWAITVQTIFHGLEESKN